MNSRSRYAPQFVEVSPRRVTPYATVRGALAALDNGGHWWSFTARKGDERIDAGELARATGEMSSTPRAFLGFELAIAGLAPDERDEVRAKLAPSLRRRVAAAKIAHLEAGAALETCGTSSCIAAGKARIVGKAAVVVTRIILIGKMPMPVEAEVEYTELEFDAGGGAKERVFARTSTGSRLAGRMRYAVAFQRARVRSVRGGEELRHAFVWAYSPLE
ncbi:MAG: hypothetical protein IPJ77_01765 [Planctomycetes bacterium]|nr:hypothetical protein [Planctomycetota bacterium]